MNPARYDFNLWTNSDYSEEIRLEVDGAAVDLTGYSVQIDFKRSPTDTLVQTINGVILSPGTDGFSITIPYETITSMYEDVVETANNGDPIVLKHDILFTAPDTTQEIYFYGNCQINFGVTA